MKVLLLETVGALLLVVAAGLSLGVPAALAFCGVAMLAKAAELDRKGRES